MKLSRYKHDSPVSYALGATLSYELLKTQPDLIRRAFLRPNMKHGADLEKIIIELEDHNIEIIESTKAFNILDAKDNCLLITEFSKPSAKIDNYPETSHIVLINPSDAGNLGTIMRSAVAFNYKNIAIITPAVDPYSPKTIRASMGALFHLNIQTFPSFGKYLEQYGRHQDQTRQLFSFMLLPDAQTLNTVKPNSNYYSIIFGNEATGLNPLFAENTTPIYIPQSTSVDSLNLSVAASIAMYHFSNIPPKH